MNINPVALDIWFWRFLIIFAISVVVLIVDMLTMIYLAFRCEGFTLGVMLVIQYLTSLVCSISGLGLFITGGIKILISIGVIN